MLQKSASLVAIVLSVAVSISLVPNLHNASRADEPKLDVVSTLEDLEELAVKGRAPKSWREECSSTLSLEKLLISLEARIRAS